MVAKEVVWGHEVLRRWLLNRVRDTCPCSHSLSAGMVPWGAWGWRQNQVEVGCGGAWCGGYTTLVLTVKLLLYAILLRVEDVTGGVLGEAIQCQHQHCR